MRASGFVLGSGLGVLAGVALILALTISGVGMHHIVIARSATQEPTTQSVITGSATPGAQVSSQVSGLETPSATPQESGASTLFTTLSPLVLAVAVGATFYGLSTRRLNAE